MVDNTIEKNYLVSKDADVLLLFEAQRDPQACNNKEQHSVSQRISIYWAHPILGLQTLRRLISGKHSWKWEELPLLEMRLTARFDNPLAAFLPVRPLVTDSTKEDAYIQLRERAKQCTDDHKSCPKIEPRKLPYRVIDVDPDATRLVLTHGKHGFYTALSYIWGMSTQPMMAETKTIDALMKSIDIYALPPTLRDVIIVTRNLGIRYLWIDSLCIIQDSRTDKDQQIGQIQYIFGNAYLTICAAKALSCNHGFLDVDIEHSQAAGFTEFNLPYLCPNDILGEIVLQPLSAYVYTAEEHPISSRAWTLEERLLSPRVAIYAYEMIIWQCRAGLFTVGGKRESMHDNEENMSASGSLRLDEAFFESAGIDGSLPTQKIEALKTMWTGILENCTHRELGHPRDRLRAISGIAATFQSVFPEMHYKAGVWFHELSDWAGLAAQLLWINNDNEWGRSVKLGDPDAHSWPWASVMSKAFIRHFGKTDEIKTVMEFVRCDTTLVSEAMLLVE